MTDPTNLDSLHDIISPAPLSFWPPAPGWYVVAFVIAVAIVWFGVTWYLSWKENRYRRDALAELDKIENSASNAPPQEICLGKLPELVKRTALAAYSRESVASLSNQKWLTFLDKSLSTTEFTSGPGQRLIHLSYQRKETGGDLSEMEVNKLLALVRKWIKHHARNPGMDPRSCDHTKDGA